ncbi:MAG: hypothetical protein WD512_16425 [Candidatus Paceibacterota bacterium]
MAILTNIQKIVDSTDRAIIKISSVFDGSGQETAATKIDVSELANAMNVNNKIMVANTHSKSSYRTTIRKVIWTVTDGIVVLEWQNQSSNNLPIFTLGAGGGVLDLSTLGSAMAIPNADVLANTNGDILVSTKGMVANSAYTVVLELKKDGRDYDQGQTRDPHAFNR